MGFESRDGRLAQRAGRGRWPNGWGKWPSSVSVSLQVSKVLVRWLGRCPSLLFTEEQTEASDLEEAVVWRSTGQMALTADPAARRGPGKAELSPREKAPGMSPLSS